MENLSMTEQVNNIIDSTKPEVEVQAQPATTTTPENVKPEQENIQDVNWRQFREARERERKQREEAEKKAKEKEAEAAAFKAALDAMVNKPAPSHEHVEESEQERIRKEVERIIASEKAKDEKVRKEREHQEMPQKLATVYSDFNRVCTAENIDYLEYHYPEIAEAYKHMPDSFDKWSNVYKSIKRFVPNTDSKKDQARVDKNFSKPQAISRPGATPTGDNAPIFLDDKKRQDNWKRMQRVMKGV